MTEHCGGAKEMGKERKRWHGKELEVICRESPEIEKRNSELQGGSQKSPLKQVVKWPDI